MTTRAAAFTPSPFSSTATPIPFRTAIMAECIKNGVSILEIYADKPNLESVFIELINRPVKKSGLEELLEETPDESAAEDDDNDEEEKEEE